MKLIELFESADKYMASKVEDSSSAEEIAEILEYHCSQMVEAYRETGVLLFRGIKEQSSGTDLFVHAHIRPDRRPVIMDPGKHEIINDAMTKKLGLKAHRGNSIFCTTNMHIASVWGKQFVVFVEDGWTGTYFKRVKTDYVFDEIYDMADRALSATYPSYDARLEALAGKIESLQPESISSRGKKLNLVLANRYEDVLITGKTYYGLNTQTELAGVSYEDVLRALDIPVHKK